MTRPATADHLPDATRTASPVARLYPSLPWTVELELRQATAQRPEPPSAQIAASAPIPQENPSTHPLHAPFSQPPAIGTKPAAAPAVVGRHHPDLPWSVESEWRQADFLQTEPADIPWLKDIRDEAGNEADLPSAPPATLTPWTDPARADPFGGAERSKAALRRPFGRSIA